MAGLVPGYSSMIANAASKKRYAQKLELVGGIDPHEVAKGDWQDDVDLWPAITQLQVCICLILAPSSYSKKDFLNYKILDCYQNLVRRWVRQVLVKPISSHFKLSTSSEAFSSLKMSFSDSIVWHSTVVGLLHSPSSSPYIYKYQGNKYYFHYKVQNYRYPVAINSPSFPFPLYCPSVSLFSCRHWFRCPVGVCFVIKITGFTRYKVPRTNAGVGIFLRSKVLSVYPREPQIASFLTQIVSFLPFILGALSRMVSERTLAPYLYPT